MIMPRDVWVNISNGSFKVWLYEEGPSCITTRWGRLGLPKHKLQSKIKISYDPWLDGRRLAASKEAKGYVPIDAMFYWDNYHDVATIIRVVSGEERVPRIQAREPSYQPSEPSPVTIPRRVITIAGT